MPKRTSGDKPAPQFEKLRRIRGYINSQDPSRIVKRERRHGHEVFHVPSERWFGVIYTVFIDENGEWICPCEDFRAQHRPCKHIAEVLHRYFPDLAPDAGEIVALFVEDQRWYRDARRFPRHPAKAANGLADSTCRDLALESMDERAESLLVDLAAVLNKRHTGPRPANRPTLPAGDKVLLRVLRNLHRKSIRRARPLAKRLAAQCKIAFAPARGSIIKYDGSEEMNDLLREAFLETVNCFTQIEDTIIIDSSGFSPYFVSCWSSSDYGRKNVKADTQWFKLHIAIGRESKAILGFVATLNSGSESSDNVQFKPLLDEIEKRGIRPKYVIADNIYLTPDNIAAAKSKGAMLIGPIKPRNYRRDGSPSEGIKPIAEIMKSDPELYDEKCRARQVVEAVFSCEKRHDNHVAAIGSSEERLQANSGERDILFVSRLGEFWARAIRYNVERTVFEEKLRNIIISYARGLVFPRKPDESPAGS